MRISDWSSDVCSSDLEEVIAASGVDFRIGGDKAFYAPGPDFVQVPPQPAFFEQVNYYRTCLHELTHPTGHSSRLGRDLLNAFRSEEHTSELQSLMRISYAVFCLKKKTKQQANHRTSQPTPYTYT